MNYTETSKTPRSQQAAIDRATETQTQIISAFGAGHILAGQAKALLDGIQDEVKSRAS